MRYEDAYMYMYKDISIALVYMYAYVYVYMHMYMYIYTHTYTMWRDAPSRWYRELFSQTHNKHVAMCKRDIHVCENDLISRKRDKQNTR